MILEQKLSETELVQVDKILNMLQKVSLELSFFQGMLIYKKLHFFSNILPANKIEPTESNKHNESTERTECIVLTFNASDKETKK